MKPRVWQGRFDRQFPGWHTEYVDEAANGYAAGWYAWRRDRYGMTTDAAYATSPVQLRVAMRQLDRAAS